jgi:hypothetical protein
MGLTNNIDDVLHRIKVNLHQNYLPNVEGRYLARTENESTLSISKICAAMKNRGGFAGSYDNLVENIRMFLDECATSHTATAVQEAQRFFSQTGVRSA